MGWQGVVGSGAGARAEGSQRGARTEPKQAAKAALASSNHVGVQEVVQGWSR